MSTDQIQTKLYERSDKETEARVEAALAPLGAYMGASCAYAWMVPLSGGVLYTYDGVKLVTTMTADEVKRAVFNKPVMKMPLQAVIPAIRDMLVEFSKSADRAAYVAQFLKDFDELKAQVAEFGARLGDVEARD